MNFKQEMQAKIVVIEQLLETHLPAQEGLQKSIMEAMEYSLLAGGKRIRPLLMQESYRLFGGTKEIIEPFMVAIELIHTYSLVHDDLPAMDNDEYRRGRKTTHVVYGEGMGILAGDALLNYAFEMIATAFANYPEDSVLIGKAMGVLARKSGIYGMIGGQVVDVAAAGTTISGEVLDFIYRLKTSALMEASLMIGAILAGANEEQVQAMEEVATKTGMAFQIQDDILDVTGTIEVLGKLTHSDEKNIKTTYVTLLGLEGAKNEVERIAREAITSLRNLAVANPFLEELLEFLIYRER